jgi:polyphosphate glucokinase
MSVILGIDIGGSGIKGAPVDLSTGSLTAGRFRTNTPKPATPASVAGAVKELADHFSWTGPIGCAFPARIAHGVAQTASNIDKSWIGTNVEKVISERMRCPVSVLNDADAACVGEHRFGAARGTSGLLMLITIGTGIGSALLIDGTLVPNTELGHLRMNGTIAEDFASDRIRKKADLSWKQWAGRFQEYLDYVEFLFAPDVILLGGGISKEKKRDQYFHLLTTRARLLPTSLENNAGIIGAAAYAGRAS